MCAGCCGAARSSMSSGTCGVPVAAAIIRSVDSGASGFGWWCAHGLDLWCSGLCPSGLWAESRGVYPSGRIYLNVPPVNPVVDTPVIIAMITNESHKTRLIHATQGVDWLAPPSLHWEMGNAFSALQTRQNSGENAVDSCWASRFRHLARLFQTTQA